VAAPALWKDDEGAARPKLRGFQALFRPLSPVWKGVLIGSGTVFMALTVLTTLIGHIGLGSVAGVTLGLLAGVLALLLGEGVFELLFATAAALWFALRRRRPFWRLEPRRAGAVFGMLTVMLAATSVWFVLTLNKHWIGAVAALVFLLPPALLGAAVGFAVLQGVKRPVTATLLALALAANVGLAGVLFYRPGFRAEAPGWAVPAGVPELAAANPSLPGTYTVQTLTYGSGTDRRRAEYGAAVGLKTGTVDLSAIMALPGGFHGGYWRWFWGFDTAHVPVNGRVWYPVGDGPFPLVVMVHGNHAGQDFSDPGYAYLGELMASRGFIFASIDENFLNGDWVGDFVQWQPLRSYLMLEHVRAIERFSAAQGNPLFGKVDMRNIALGGHSRGGEAAATAAVFSRMATYPGNSNVAMDYNFSIKAVLALAPADGIYKMDNAGVVPWNVDYLILQGAHDTDMYFFAGANQYQRVAWNDGQYHFKSALYAYHMDHGAMNTVWKVDGMPPRLWFYNEAPLMTAQQQRQVVKTYASAFLEASLHGRQEYLPLLRDARTGADWLPGTTYAALFQDSTFQALADYEEDFNPETGTDGASIVGQNVALQDKRVDLRGPIQRSTTAAQLRWPVGAGPASYTVTVPDRPLVGWKPVTAASRLVFALAGASVDQPGQAPIDLTVELADDAGQTARLPLSRWGTPLARPAHSLTKLGLFDHLVIKTSTMGPILQTFELPLSAFVAANPAFAPESVREVRFLFDRTPAGSVVIDEVGFRTGP
jgi:dienelactone hydrolase